MPQLDKVTLFSQVFWLLFLYFFFFLLFLCYYLPKFSKLFKIRAYYLFTAFSKNNLNDKASLNGTQHLSNILVNFNILLKSNLVTIIKQYSLMLQSYNFIFLKKVNNLFIVTYIFNCLKYNLYKKLYL